MKEHSIQDLGTLVHLFTKGNHPDTAQIYLNEMQERVTAAKKSPLLRSAVKVLVAEGATSPNDILQQLPMEETAEPTLTYESKTLPVMEEPEEGLIFDGDGNIIAISSQPGSRGYDPGAHEKQIRIFCDGRHIETAHTADVEAGIVKYYEKNAKGRIKTLEVRGRVSIKAHIPDGDIEIS